jgi:hypothetical protein
MPRRDLTSAEQATAGPNAQSIVGSEGPVSRQSLDALLLLPHQFRDFARAITDLKDALMGALAPVLYANGPALSDATVTQIGATATGYVKVFPPAASGAITELCNIMVGSDTAGRVALYACRADTFYADDVGTRLLGSVRLNATENTRPFAGRLLLQTGETLYVYHAASSSAKVDFSCDYRLLRGR